MTCAYRDTLYVWQREKGKRIQNGLVDFLLCLEGNSSLRLANALYSRESVFTSYYDSLAVKRQSGSWLALRLSSLLGRIGLSIALLGRNLPITAQCPSHTNRRIDERFEAAFFAVNH